MKEVIIGLVCTFLSCSSLLIRPSPRFSLKNPFKMTTAELSQTASTPIPLPTPLPQSSIVLVDPTNSVDSTWHELEDFGETLTKYSRLSLFYRALAAGVL